MKKIKKLIILIVFLFLFGMLHCYTEWKFNNNPPKGVIEKINEWTGLVTYVNYSECNISKLLFRILIL